MLSIVKCMESLLQEGQGIAWESAKKNYENDCKYEWVELWG